MGEKNTEGEVSVETIDTTPVINYSASERTQFAVDVEFTFTLPVANDQKSGYVALMATLAEIDSISGVNLDDYEFSEVVGEDKPEPGCPIPNMPDPDEEREQFLDAIENMQHSVNIDDGHEPFEGVDREYERKGGE